MVKQNGSLHSNMAYLVESESKCTRKMKVYFTNSLIKTANIIVIYLKMRTFAD